MPTIEAINFSDARLIPLKNPSAARKEDINLAAGTYVAGQLVGEVTATPGTYTAYNSTKTNGGQNPAFLLEYKCIVDTDGNIWIGDLSGASEWGKPAKAVSAFRNGLFSCADLTGLDANAVPLLGHLVRGNTTAGELMVAGS